MKDEDQAAEEMAVYIIKREWHTPYLPEIGAPGRGQE